MVLTRRFKNVNKEAAMSETMRKEDLERKLMESLGVREPEYKKRVTRWLSMKMANYTELEESFAGFLSASEFSLHNAYIKTLIRSCRTPLSSREKESAVNQVTSDNIERRGVSQDQSTYFSHEAPKIPRMSRTDRHQVPATSEQDIFVAGASSDKIHQGLQGDQVFKEQPPLMIKEGAILSPKLMLERILFGAYELELDGVTPESAEYLCIATQFFLKNILTSIICRRKGFKVKYNKFVYDIGSCQLNPWLRNVSRGKNDYFYPLRVDKTQSGFLAPNPRPSKEFVEQNSVFELVTRESDAEVLAPISLMDLAVTLKMHPSLVASNFIRTVNWERLLSRIHHPTWDS